MLKIKELRRELGLSQKELAQKVEISWQSISGYETGHAQPPVDILVKIADALQTSTDFLLGRENDYGVVEVKGAELTIEQNKLLNFFGILNQRGQIKVLSYIEGLTEAREYTVRG